MTVMTSYPPGTFCWVDLVTPSPLDAKAFYGELFGWEFEDRPAGPAVTYTLCKISNFNVCALYEQDGAEQAQHIPPRWTSYVAVASTDQAAAAAGKAGGTVLVPAFDVLDAGRMAMIRDPTGGVVGLWQPRAHFGADLVNEPGALCWNELQTGDCSRAGAFYAELFGWQAMHDATSVPPYTEFMQGEHPAGGMLALQPEWGAIPPHWLVYFAVANCDESAGLAAELGASLCVEPRDVPGIGRFCVLQDPQGATFAIIHLLHPD